MRRPGRGSPGIATAIGSELHRRHQEAVLDEDPAARAEVPLEAELEVDGWRVRIRGRADLVRESPEAVQVEELKSFWPDDARGMGAPGVPDADVTIHTSWRRQVTTYAWLLQRASRVPVTCRLVLLPIGEGEARSVAVPFRADATEAEIRAACARQVAREERLRKRALARREIAHRIRWPRPAYRPGQAEVTEAIETALGSGDQLLVHAPTGIGKTLAALVPALRDALENDRHVFFATASGTGRRAALDALAEIVPDDLGGTAAPRTTVLKARAGMCANDMLLCHEAACRFAAGHPDATRDGSLIEACFGPRRVATPEVVFSRAEPAGACPFALSLDAAEASVVSVGDLNYAFDPEVRLWTPDDPVLARTVVIADEVHQVAARVRQALSTTLDVVALERAAESCGFGGAAIHREQEHLLRRVAEALRELIAETTGIDPSSGVPFEMPVELAGSVFADWMPRLDLVLMGTLAYRRATGALTPDDPFLLTHRALRRFFRTFAPDAGRFATVAYATAPGSSGSMQPVGTGLNRICLDASASIGRLLSSVHAFVGLSGSLSPLELHESDLGLDPARRARIEVGDPFPQDCRHLVIDPRVDTRFERRAKSLPRIARTLAGVAEATPGATLALLSSHAQVDALIRALPALSIPVHRQHPEDADAERQSLIATLDQGEPGLTLAVAGGVLAESLDLAPGALRCVIVVGPCLPPPTAEQQLLEAHYEELAGAGFDWAFVAPGMRRVVQAAGRLVRRETDRGLLVLLGRRFLRDPFRAALPESWLGGRSAEECAGDPVEVARERFAAG